MPSRFVIMMPLLWGDSSVTSLFKFTLETAVAKDCCLLRVSFLWFLGLLLIDKMEGFKLILFFISILFFILMFELKF